MSLERELVRRIKRSDVGGVVDVLVNADEKTRRAASDAVRQHYRELPYGGPQRGACLVAVLGCGTVKDIKGLFGTAMVSPRAADVIAARPQRIADGVVRVGIEGEWTRWLWPAIRALVQRGVIDEPEDEGYLIGLLLSTASQELMGLEWRQDRLEPATAQHLADRIRREPDLVDLVFRALLIDEGPALWASGLWFEALPLLVATGDLERDRALNEALGGYLADLRPTSARRFGDLWKALAPTVDEVRARRTVLIKMAGTHDPGAQKLALAELSRLVKTDGTVDAIDVIDACGTPLNGTQKNLAMAALRLLRLVGGDYPQEAVATVVTGLGHARSDVQEAVLDFVATHIAEVPDGAAVRADLLGWADAVAPQLRPRIAALAGVEAPRATAAPPELAGLVAAASRLVPGPADELALPQAVAAVERGAMPPPVTFRPWNPGALATKSPIVPVANHTELVEVLAAVLSGSADGIDIERALDGLSRFADARPGRSLATSLQTHFDNVARQFGEGALRNPLVLAAETWVTGREPAPLPFLERDRGRLFSRKRRGLAGNLVTPRIGGDARDRRWAQFDGAPQAANFEGMGLVRAWEVAYRCHRRQPRPLLSFPSHEAGWIEPAVLADRLAWYVDAHEIPDRFDACQAVLRLAPVTTPEVRSQLRALATSVAHAALRVLGESAPVDDEGLLRATSTELDLGPPAGHLKQPAEPRYAALPVVFFPEAAVAAPPRRDDPVGVALATLRTPPARLSWWNSSSAILAGVTSSAMAWAATMAPRYPDLLGAAVAATVIRDLDSNRTSDVDDMALAALLSPDVPLGVGAHTGLAVALVARNDALGTIAVDLLSQAATDGRLDAVLLGRLLAQLHAAGIIALARSGPRIVAAAEVSALNAEQGRRVFAALVGHLESVPRDIHAVLDAWLSVATQVGRGVTENAARNYLEDLVAASPRSKRGKLAASLLALPQGWDDHTPELLALDARITRARRWAEGSRSAEDTVEFDVLGG